MLTDLSTLGLRVLEMAMIFGIGYFLVQFRGDDLSAPMVADHLRVSGLGMILYSTVATASGAYDPEALFARKRRWSLLLRSWAFTGLFLVVLGFLLKATPAISREWALTWFVSCAAALGFGTLISSALMRSVRREGVFDVRTAVYGSGPQAEHMLDYVRGNPDLMLKIVGRFDDRSKDRVATSGEQPFIGGLAQLLALIRQGKIDQVIVALPWSFDKRIQEIVQQLALTPVRIRLAPDLVGFTYRQKPFILLGDLPVMTLFDRPISGLDQSLKWLEDQILGYLLLVLLSPLFLVVAIAIKLDSPGPVFFRQPREGFNDRSFRVWKFRSMHQDDCEVDAIEQAKKTDARVTRVGAFLRRSSIDELPQLFNVIAGDMSLVGPRPHAPSTKAGQRLFRDAVSTYAARHRVKPGITGWAQVRGWRGPTDTEEKLVGRLDHDLYYIENWSLAFDMLILARTVVAVLSSKNAH
jgi:polysaccharide biosynthesis protein PslA